MEYIEIDKDLLPYKFSIVLSEKTYTFHINYNYTKDFFTIDLYLHDESLIIGEKIVYGKALFSTIKHKDIPKVKITPYDKSGNNQIVNYDTLNESVFLYVEGVNNEILG